MHAPGPDESDWRECLARQKIDQLMRRYCRGMDRADQALLESVFHPEATVITGTVDGSGALFARTIVAHLRENVTRCQHFVNSGWIEIDGTRACGEFYVFATMEAGGTWTAGGGRYADEFEFHEGAWKIKAHVFISDWLLTLPAATDSHAAFFPPSLPRGAFGDQDYIYQLWSRYRR